MKMLMLSKFFAPQIGGISTYFFKLAIHFHSQDLNIKVLTPISGADNYAFDEKQIFPIIRLREGRIRFIKRFVGIVQVFFRLIQFKPEVVFLSNWTPYGIFIVLLRKVVSFKIVCSAHGSEILRLQSHNKKYDFLSYIGIYCLKKIDKIFAVSNYTRQLVVQLGIRPEKVVFIPNGVDINDFGNIGLSRSKLFKKYCLKNIDDKFIILTISHLTKRKGHETVLKAILELKKSHAKIHYLIGGSGPYMQELKFITEKMDLMNSITFLGKIPQNDLPAFYIAADVFVMVSFEETNNADIEGFGIVFFEANACKTPVIGTLSGGIPDAIIDGFNGFLITPKSNDILADKITFLIKNKKERLEMGKRGYDMVKESYSWSKITTKIVKELELVV